MTRIPDMAVTLNGADSLYLDGDDCCCARNLSQIAIHSLLYLVLHISFKYYFGSY